MQSKQTYRFGDLLAREQARYPANDYGSDEHSAEYHRLALGTVQDNTPTRSGKGAH